MWRRTAATILFLEFIGKSEIQLAITDGGQDPFPKPSEGDGMFRGPYFDEFAKALQIVRHVRLRRRPQVGDAEGRCGNRPCRELPYPRQLKSITAARSRLRRAGAGARRPRPTSR